MEVGVVLEAQVLLVRQVGLLGQLFERGDALGHQRSRRCRAVAGVIDRPRAGPTPARRAPDAEDTGQERLGLVRRVAVDLQWRGGEQAGTVPLGRTHGFKLLQFPGGEKLVNLGGDFLAHAR